LLLHLDSFSQSLILLSQQDHFFFCRHDTTLQGSSLPCKPLVLLKSYHTTRKKKHLERHTTKSNTHHRRHTSRMYPIRIRTKNTQHTAKRPLQTRSTSQRTDRRLYHPLPRKRHMGQHTRAIHHLRTSMLPLLHIRTRLRAKTRV